mmetsp:Transcript_15203/g.61103  ORF Transcript_15203/g.61103 Transcript_15203/m.61103 type:complete len:349 (-) Transcript_15203:266-1312(-)
MPRACSRRQARRSGREWPWGGARLARRAAGSNPRRVERPRRRHLWWCAVCEQLDDDDDGEYCQEEEDAARGVDSFASSEEANVRFLEEYHSAKTRPPPWLPADEFVETVTRDVPRFAATSFAEVFKTIENALFNTIPSNAEERTARSSSSNTNKQRRRRRRAAVSDGERTTTTKTPENSSGGADSVVDALRSAAFSAYSTVSAALGGSSGTAAAAVLGASKRAAQAFPVGNVIGKRVKKLKFPGVAPFVFERFAQSALAVADWAAGPYLRRELVVFAAAIAPLATGRGVLASLIALLFFRCLRGPIARVYELVDDDAYAAAMKRRQHRGGDFSTPATGGAPPPPAQAT